MSNPQVGQVSACLVACETPFPPRHALAGVSAPAGLLGRLLHAFLQWRNRNRMRRAAESLDDHLLKDVGAPDWLVSEVSVNREFKRLHNIDYLRW